MSWGEVLLHFVIFFLCFTWIRSDLGEPETVLTQTQSLYRTQGHRGIQRDGKEPCSCCRLPSLAEQHLHDSGVSQGRKVTQVFFIAGDLSQNSTHDLTCRTGEKLEFRSKSSNVGRNWKVQDPGTWACFGKPWCILDEIWGGDWSDLLPHWMKRSR